jgi:signal transduction histidine kinase
MLTDLTTSHVHVSTPPMTGSLVASRPRAERVLLCYKALLETSQLLNRTSDFHEVLQFILRKMLDVGRADSAVMFITDEMGGFQFVGGRNAENRMLGEGDVQLSQGVLNRMVSTQDTVCIRDVALDPVLRNDMDLAAQYIGGVIALPMLRGDTILGIIHLGRRDAMPWIDDLDLTTLRSMAAQLSLLTDNAIALSEIARLNESVDAEVQSRTEQLSEANSWLAANLQRAECDIAAQAELQKSRSRFYAALSHELRSPTQLLLGHAYLALDEGAGNLSSLQHNSLNVILKTCEHIQNLVSKVMDAGKLEEGGMTISAAPLDVRPLIGEAIELSRGLLKNKPVELSQVLPDYLPNVVGDGTRIRQVLLNLLANACRFTDQGSIIVTAAASNAYVTVSVSDTGVGISAENLETVFEPYTQIDSLRSHNGAGLGLTISKQLVELHGGKLWVKSKIGSGSTFYFTLPSELS